MGGTAYVIHGTVEPWRLEAMPRKKSLLDKLLRRQRYDNPTYYDHGRSILIEVPPRNLEQLLIDAFRKFLAQQISNPWSATHAFYDYLDIGVMSIFLRGEQSQDTSDVDWYVQIGFSGCAGMAQVTSELGYHWTYLWLQQEIRRITETIFKPQGFAPNEDLECVDDYVTFVPFDDYGYAIYHPASDSPEQEGYFDMDAGVLEVPDDEGEKLLQTLQAKLGTMMADGKCRCQLCAPDFSPDA